jgi:hypothetical protein
VTPLHELCDAVSRTSRLYHAKIIRDSHAVYKWIAAQGSFDPRVADRHRRLNELGAGDGFQLHHLHRPPTGGKNVWRLPSKFAWSATRPGREQKRSRQPGHK